MTLGLMQGTKRASAFFVPVSTSSIGPNRESTAGGWVYRSTTGAVTSAP